MLQIDVESLRVLLAVLDHGGMTSAARHLDMGQSAVSRKVQRLEDRVGRPLLIRDGHALRPTRDGRALLDDARAMVALHDRAVDRLRSSDLTGTVRLSSNGEVDSCQIASLLGVFKCRHPNANVEFTIDHTGSLIDDVDAGTIDLAVFQVTEEAIRADDHQLWTEDLVWATSASSRTHTEPLPLIDFGPHCYYNEFTHRVLDNAGIKFRSIFSAASSYDVRAAVEAGIGVAVLSRRYLDADIVTWKPPIELDPLPRVTQVIRAVPGERPDAVAALIDIIRSELTEGRS